MEYNEIKKSLKKQVENIVSPKTFEVREVKTTIKEYNSSDLPAYFKWTAGSNPWYYRVRLRQGKIVTDLMRKQTEGWEVTYATISSAFDPSNETIHEDEWRNIMHEFTKELQ